MSYDFRKSNLNDEAAAAASSFCVERLIMRGREGSAADSMPQQTVLVEIDTSK